MPDADAISDPTASSPPRGSLTIVGTGIRLVGQTTLEAVRAIEAADRVFYLVSSPAAAVWIRRLNARAVSLHDCYGQDKPRIRSYAEMIDRILAEVRSGFRVCAAFYGHPAVGVDPAHEVRRIAAAEGHPVCMLPGVSAEACLYADLGVDPLSAGCQSYEATDFVQRQPVISTSAALLLWQIGIVGETTARFGSTPYRPGLERLVSTLLRYYDGDHEIVVYEAACYPVFDPMILRAPLRDMPQLRISPITTLFVPPVATALRAPDAAAVPPELDRRG